MAMYGMTEAFGILAVSDGETGSNRLPVSRVLGLIINHVHI